MAEIDERAGASIGSLDHSFPSEGSGGLTAGELIQRLNQQIRGGGGNATSLPGL